MPSIRAILQVTSVFLGIFREKIWPSPNESKNVSKTAKIECYDTRFHTFPRPEIHTAQGAFYGHGMSLKMSQVAWNEYMYGCIYVHLEAILGLTRNEQMRCSKVFRDNANGAKYPRNVTSHAGFLRNISRETMTGPEVVQKCPKNSQN